LDGSILVLNAGSSSLKFALFDAETAASEDMNATARGEVANLEGSPHLVAHDNVGTVIAEQHWPAGKPRAFETVLHTLLAFADDHLGQRRLTAVGHRVVHSGADHVAPADVALLADLETLTALEPLHMPHNIAPIHAAAAARPALL
jgi:acetate kinase